MKGYDVEMKKTKKGGEGIWCVYLYLDIQSVCASFRGGKSGSKVPIYTLAWCIFTNINICSNIDPPPDCTTSFKLNDLTILLLLFFSLNLKPMCNITLCGSYHAGSHTSTNQFNATTPMKSPPIPSPPSHQPAPFVKKISHIVPQLTFRVRSCLCWVMERGRLVATASRWTIVFLV